MLDASVVVDLVLDIQPAADRAWTILLDHEGDAHAPHLLDAEVVQVVRRWTARGDMSAARARRAIARLDELPLTRYPHGFLLQRSFALRGNLSSYDALYLALAEALGAPLLTKDAAFETVPRRRANVLTLPDD